MYLIIFRALTPDTVMFQLKYRYDREVDGCQRYQAVTLLFVLSLCVCLDAAAVSVMGESVLCWFQFIICFWLQPYTHTAAVKPTILNKGYFVEEVPPIKATDFTYFPCKGSHPHPAKTHVHFSILLLQKKPQQLTQASFWTPVGFLTDNWGKLTWVSLQQQYEQRHPCTSVCGIVAYIVYCCVAWENRIEAKNCNFGWCPLKGADFVPFHAKIRFAKWR